MKFSFLIPSRDGLEYLKLAYDSIRTNQGNHDVGIFVLDDMSVDGTFEWCKKIMECDKRFVAFRNEETRMGISTGYRFLFENSVGEIVCHWHNDMIMTEGTLESVLNEFETNPNSVISLTRVEPPIYQSGKEKIVWKDAPLDYTTWDTDKFKLFLKGLKFERTKGHFAPFFMYRKNYEVLGGNDTVNFPLQAREDSDFAFRLRLAGYDTVQIPQFVYHFASRGNRRAKDLYTDNPEWLRINAASTLNFIRKWHTFDLHDENLEPNKPVRYDDVCFHVKNPSSGLVNLLEPWCDFMFVDFDVSDLIEAQQPDTRFNLTTKFHSNRSEGKINVYIDGKTFNDTDYRYICNLMDMLDETGEYTASNLKIRVNELEDISKRFIYAPK